MKCFKYINGDKIKKIKALSSCFNFIVLFFEKINAKLNLKIKVKIKIKI